MVKIRNRLIEPVPHVPQIHFSGTEMLLTFAFLSFLGCPLPPKGKEKPLGALRKHYLRGKEKVKEQSLNFGFLN